MVEGALASERSAQKSRWSVRAGIAHVPRAHLAKRDPDRLRSSFCALLLADHRHGLGRARVGRGALDPADRCAAAAPRTAARAGLLAAQRVPEPPLTARRFERAPAGLNESDPESAQLASIRRCATAAPRNAGLRRASNTRPPARRAARARAAHARLIQACPGASAQVSRRKRPSRRHRRRSCRRPPRSCWPRRRRCRAGVSRASTK